MTRMELIARAENALRTGQPTIATLYMGAAITSTRRDRAQIRTDWYKIHATTARAARGYDPKDTR